MDDPILGRILLWSIEASVVIGIAALLRLGWRNKPSNIQAAVLTATVICIWLIPFSPHLIKPFIQYEQLQSALAILERGRDFFFPKDSSLPHGESPLEFAPTPIKTADQSSTAYLDFLYLPEQGNPVPKGQLLLSPSAHPRNPSWLENVYHVLQSSFQYKSFFLKVLLGTWILGMIFFFIRWLHSWWSISGIAASATEIKDTQILEFIERTRQLFFIHKKIVAKQSYFPIAPFIKGIRQPVLILPVSLLEESSATDIKAIIMHELAHLRRYDLEIHQLIRILKMILWFLPPIWWLQKKLYNDQDIASDECAAVVLGSGLEIGEALTHLAEFYLEQKRDYSMTGFFEDKNALLQRLDNIASTPISKLTRIPLLYHFTLLLFTLLTLASTGIVGVACYDSHTILGIQTETDDRSSFVYQKDSSHSVLSTDHESTQPTVFKKLAVFSEAILFATQVAMSVSMEIGDVNGDGWMDIVNGTDVGEGKSIFLNEAGRSIRASQVFSGRRDIFTSIALADLDQDHDPDLITGQYFKPNQFFLNDGTGTFSHRATFGEANSFTQFVKIGDFDSDGYPDIAQYNRNRPCQIFWNNGLGQFPDHTEINAKGWNHAHFQILDWDYDKDFDLVIAPYRESVILIYENHGSRHFLERQKSFPSEISHDAPKIIMSDLFGGHKRNLAVFLLDKNRSRIFTDDGDSTLIYQTQVPQPRTSFYEYSRTLDIGDVDEDGDIDLVLGNYQLPVQLLLNEGNGQFADPIPIGTGGKNTIATRLTDMDADGDLDIVIGNQESPGVVYRNEMPLHVTSVTPKENEILTALPTNITIHFSHSMKPCHATNFIVHGSFTGIRTGRYQRVDEKTSQFIPDRPFLPGETIRVTLTQEVMSSSQQPLPKPFQWSFTTATIQGNASFQTSRRFFGPDYNRARCLALGDLNGDGNIDIVTGSDENGSQVYFNDGHGIFDAAHSISPTREDTLSLAVCDIDGDGDMDVLSGNSDRYPNKIYLNRGNGEFPQEIKFPCSHGHSNALTEGDINGDGRIDLIFANNIASAGDHRIYLNQGNGAFRELSRLSSGLITIRAFGLTDLDRDRDLDLISLGWGSSNYIVLNDGTGNFLQERQWLCSASGIALNYGDMDNDCDIDLICLRQYEASEMRTADLLSLRNQGKNAFESKLLCELLERQNDICSGDIDGDGDIDIVLTSSDKETKRTLFRNSGRGEFNPETEREPIHSESSRIALADLNGDGKLDLVTARYGGKNTIDFQDIPSPQTAEYRK